MYGTFPIDFFHIPTLSLYLPIDIQIKTYTMAPSTQQQWRVQGKGNGTFDNLNFNKEAPVPEVGDKDVLVKCE